MSALLASLGDRLGLFKDLAAHGPATSAELAKRTGLNERYLREWLGGLAAADYLTYDTGSKRFALPAEHAAALAQEGGPMFVGGMLQQLPALVGVFDEVAAAFKTAAACRRAAMRQACGTASNVSRRAGSRISCCLRGCPRCRTCEAHLERGADVADVGCGRGRALIKLAGAFPRSRYVGFDNFGPTVERAAANAREAGVGNLVRFEERDVSKGLPGTYHVITTFDVVHDAVDPLGLLKTIRNSLHPDGVYVCLDINCGGYARQEPQPVRRDVPRREHALLHDDVARERRRRPRHARLS